MAERYDFVEYYKKDDARRAMAAALANPLALTGPTPKLPKRGAGSQKIPGYGDVFGPINKALAEERAREAREQAARDAREQAARDKQFENADWRL